MLFSHQRRPPTRHRNKPPRSLEGPVSDAFCICSASGGGLRRPALPGGFLDEPDAVFLSVNAPFVSLPFSVWLINLFDLIVLHSPSCLPSLVSHPMAPPLTLVRVEGSGGRVAWASKQPTHDHSGNCPECKVEGTNCFGRKR